MRPDPGKSYHAGHEWKPCVEGDDWRVATEIDAAKRCRHQRCGGVVVAALNRKSRVYQSTPGGGRRFWHKRDAWWPYCAEHTYGRWVEDGKVMHWRLFPVPQQLTSSGLSVEPLPWRQP